MTRGRTPTTRLDALPPPSSADLPPNKKKRARGRSRKGRTMETRTINNEYTRIGYELIDQEAALVDIANSQAQIIFLSSDKAKLSKGKAIHAECEKISDKYKWGIPCDFTITVFEPNVQNFTDEQIKILLFHELLHVGVEFKEDGGETYFTKPHDLEDFKLIIDQYGTEWSKTE